MTKRIISLMLAAVMLVGVLALAACGGGSTKPDALVIMTDELDGLFNPFFSTTAADATIVSMTQIGMLGSTYENGKVNVAFGNDHAVAVLDYVVNYDSATDKTTYTFVLKNNIVFSDGHPLTIEDVLFNLYVYLDPVYTGSSTMYSTDIVGLQDYRTQTVGSDSSNVDDTITSAANDRAQDRLNELINLFKSVGKTSTAGSYSASYDQMVAAIGKHTPSKGYVSAISNNAADVTNKNLLDDYNEALRLFKEELKTDYVSAKEAYLEDPYKSTGEFDEVTSFMYAEGYVTVEYEKDPVTNKDIKSKIKKVTRQYNADVVKDMDSAIEYVYNSKIEQELHVILSYWATANELRTSYAAKAKEVILRANMTDGQLTVPNISGIVSLGHTTDVATVTAQNGTYTVAHEHDANGVPSSSDQYDVLQITINGTDPKAIWNFSFAVAPQHYYAEGYTVDIANNKFGVDYASFDYMTTVIQSPRNIALPMGAGAYKVSDVNNSDSPAQSDFHKNNVVYFKANNSFMMGAPKIEKVRYQVVSASNAISALESGSVHFVTPQFTQANIDLINGMAKKGIEKTYTDQLGYGYIGINAGKVPNIYLRKAIMSAMNTSLALSYYSTGMAETIYWPMSTVSWAYPKDASGNNNRDNLHDYPAVSFSDDAAKSAIEEYMGLAGVSAGDSALSIKFTIAGSNLTDHPTYQTFQHAADLLNSCGWNIEVVPDTQALTKLSTGSLAVWAAAWGTTVDPDMYQVYHKNSTATSTLAWGYREILASPASYPEENQILNKLSAVIDDARETDDQAIRTGLYKEAMGYILDLAIELPVYQRKVLYAYNANVIDPSSFPEEINPYTSPLDKIWEIEFAD
ncbi:MAG: ABC transporter substrate-binding protein [Eubacteriales bacterium]